ncbi:MAG: hypothetical protein KKH68_08500 [Proteobacteria bacterium]|nr:hypothetical protein [Pseudomonadota bacterium]
MISDDIFFTKTMAKVYADQGNLGKAAEIYKYLLKNEPARQDLIDAFAEIEEKRFENNSKELIELFSTWIDLLLMLERLRKLRKVQKTI